MSVEREHVVALIPCRNGADSIAPAVAALKADPNVDEVVVIDDASRDESALVAAAAGARVVLLPVNRGKGDAVAAGIAAASDADIYLLVDADTGESASEVTKLLLPIRHDEADLVVGVLPSAAGRGGFGLVKRVASWGIRRACGFEGEAPLSGQRAVSGDLLRSLRPAARFGLEVGMTIDAVRSGARVVEHAVEIEHLHRGRSVGGFLHRGRQGRDIVEALWPRLVSVRGRAAIVAISTLILLISLTIWSYSGPTDDASAPLPRADKVKIVLVPGASWTDGDDRVFDVGSIAGSLVTGDVKDVISATQAGSRKHEAPPSPEVEVEVTIHQPQVEPGEVAIVAGVTTVKQMPELRPVTIVGVDAVGTLVSPSTHREGLLDLTDLAPTALTMMGKAVPNSMTGSAARVAAGAPSTSELAQENEFALFSKRILPLVIGVYLAIQTVLYLVALGLARRRRQARFGVELGAAIAAFPLATYLVTALTNRLDLGIWVWSAICALIVGMIVGMSSRAARSPADLLRRIMFMTMVLIVVDILTGARLQVAGVFGSSPLLGARYFGIGNPASMVLLASAVVWTGLHVANCRDRRAAVVRTAAVFAVLAAVVGLPGLGSDVGGLVAVSATGALLVGLLAGVPIAKRLAGIAAVATTGVVLVVSLVDYLRPEASRTHLGRLFADVVESGPSPLVEVIVRKIEVNFLGYAFPWSIAVALVAVALFVALMRGTLTKASLVPHSNELASIRQNVLWPSTLPAGSLERTIACTVVAAGLFSFFLNDSGIVVLALVAVFLGPFVLVQHHLHHVSSNQLEVVAP